MPDGLVLSWRALAAFLVDAAERGEHLRKIVVLSLVGYLAREVR
jgi:hypothetical protein